MATNSNQENFFVAYKNRKIYYPYESRYVTIEQVYEFIKEGRPVTIVRKTDGVDVTSMLLGNNLMRHMLKKHNLVPKFRLIRALLHGVGFEKFRDQQETSQDEVSDPIVSQVEATTNDTTLPDKHAQFDELPIGLGNRVDR
ncbi:MAG: polyhydroxyalkanoate synthesis regulator DNA-binding domain-containing protein [Candidatus Bilamarchaeaceae archaeon]